MCQEFTLRERKCRKDRSLACSPEEHNTQNYPPAPPAPRTTTTTPNSQAPSPSLPLESVCNWSLIVQRGFMAVCVCVCVCNSLQMGPQHPNTYKIHEPCATFRRCRCSCAIKQCHVQCSEKCTNVHREKKIETKRKRKPKAAPWLRTPEPPITKNKRGKRKGGNTMAPRKKTGPEKTSPKRPPTKSPIQTNPVAIPNQANRIPQKLRNQTKGPTSLLKHSRSHPQRPLNPPPPPGGHGPRARAEGTWPSTVGHREGGSPSSSGRCRG